MPGLAPANADLKSGPDNTGDRANAVPLHVPEPQPET